MKDKSIRIFCDEQAVAKFHFRTRFAAHYDMNAWFIKTVKQKT